MLPTNLCNSQYKAKYTLQLKVRRQNWAALLPINLIHLQCCDGRAPAAARKDPDRSVCENFDLSLCSVALGTINEDLTLGELLEFNQAFAALRSRTLVLNDTAFSSNSKTVDRQMIRIAKYVDRGCHW